MIRQSIHRSVVVLGALLLISGMVSAQTFDFEVRTETAAIPPTPTASSLGKYADIPVSLYTGVPDISIPLYQINSRALSLPITINYHSSGVKVEDIASWVGMGWSLNAGGVITRKVNNVPDDLYSAQLRLIGDFPFSQPINIGYLHNANTINSMAHPATDLTNSNQRGNLKLIASGALDSEPDVFYFNFGTYTGKFVFDETGTPRIAADQKLKINHFKTATGPLTKFEIITEDGVKYIFDQVEQTSYVTGTFSGAAFFPSYDDAWFVVGNNASPTVYNSSWFLSRIESPNVTDAIDLSYADENTHSVSTVSLRLGAVPRQSNIGTDTDSKRLTQITWPGGRIDFVADLTRTDIDCFGGFFEQNSKVLTGINIYDVNNEFISGYDFEYDNFVAYGCGDYPSNIQCSCSRLFLESITEKADASGSVINRPYLFTYDETQLPNRYSAEQDFWGYFNQNGSTLLHQLIPHVYVYPNDPIGSTLSNQTIYSIYPRINAGTEIFLEGTDRSPDPIAMQAGILKKITYPTGGHTAFEYESHEFHFGGQNLIGGGLRIKQITDFDGADPLKNIVKTFTYNLSSNPGVSSGKVIYLPQYARASGANPGGTPGTHAYESARARVFSHSLSGLGATQGSPVGYAEVTVDYNGNGKTINKFSLPGSFDDLADCPGGTCIYERSRTDLAFFGGWAFTHPINVDLFPFPSNPNYDWNRGDLIEQLDFDNSGNLIRKVVQEFEVEDHKIIRALKLGLVVSLGSGLNFDYKYGKYYYLSGWKVLKKRDVELFNVSNPTSSFISTEEYFYDNSNHLQLTRFKRTNSDGIEYTTKFKYPLDYDQGKIHQINTLADLHMHNQIVETIGLEKKPGQSDKVIFGQVTDYVTNSSGNPLPRIVSHLETSLPLTNFIESHLDGSSTLIRDFRYQQSTIALFNAVDNPVALFRPNGPRNTQIWGYNQLSLVATLTNAPLSQVALGLTASYLGFEDDDESNDNPDEDYWSFNTSNTHSTNAHTGKFSRFIEPKGASVQIGPERVFRPGNSSQQETFVFSAWVKTEAGFGSNNGWLNLSSHQDLDGPLIPLPASSVGIKTAFIHDTNGEWKYVEVRMDLKEVKLLGGISSNVPLRLKCQVVNNNPNKHFLVDDIRFQPANALMTTYSYNGNQQVTSVTDENNVTIFYEYDEFNRLHLVRDDDNNILSKTEYHFKNQ